MSRFPSVIHKTTPVPPSPPSPPPGKNYGLFYLFPAFQIPSRKPDPASSAGLHNPNIQGMLWRQTWYSLEPTAGQRDYSYIQTCMGLSDSNGKIASHQMIAGQGAPPWFFSTYPSETLFLTDNSIGNTTVPWGPNFLSHWTAVQQELASLIGNNPNLKYVAVTGVGNASESFLVRSTPGNVDEIAANALAVRMGYANLSAAWTAGTQALIDMYMSTWPKQQVVLVTGIPFPTGGDAALLSIYQTNQRRYGNRFGCRPDNLTSNSPQSTEPSVNYVNICKGSLGTGFQFGSPQNVNDPNPPNRLDLALKRGIGYGAHYLELFPNDADDPASVPAMRSAMAQLGITTNASTI